VPPDPRVWIGASLALALVLALPALAQGAESAARELAVKYSLVLSLEPQAKACGTGEAYRPTTADVMLSRQEVLLTGGSCGPPATCGTWDRTDGTPERQAAEMRVRTDRPTWDTRIRRLAQPRGGYPRH